MEYLITLFKLASTLSPLAVIALLVGLLYIALTQHKSARNHSVEIQSHFDTLRHNDLHTLTEMAETLRRIEHAQTQNFATIIQRLK